MNEKTVKALAANVQQLLANHERQAHLYRVLLQECLYMLEGNIKIRDKAELIAVLKVITGKDDATRPI